jgi:hypothetical protein
MDGPCVIIARTILRGGGAMSRSFDAPKGQAYRCPDDRPMLILDYFEGFTASKRTKNIQNQIYPHIYPQP